MMSKNCFVRRPVHFGLLILLAQLFTTCAAHAWNNVGHRTIAELAWRQMNDDERRAASELLRQHPHYEQYLAADVPAGVSPDEWVFLTAAIWPDWVRPAKKGQPHKSESITKYNLYPHAIGHPFLRAGDTNRALLQNFQIAQPNAEMVLSNSITTLRDPKASAPDRAVSLCWVLHLFGDLHQPLHAANRVTAARPLGEGLGGEHFVRDARGQQINLHVFWDQLPGVASGYHTIATLADSLAADPGLKPAELREYRENKTIPAWVQEGFRAAVDFAYAEDQIQFAHADALKSGDTQASQIPTLPAAYQDQAREIARRRLVLAGRRLADVLKEVW